MTDFERQVALALHELLEHAKCPDGFPQPNDWERASHIAPRVAAAIEEGADWCGGASHEDALAALRGSGETPQP